MAANKFFLPGSINTYLNAYKNSIFADIEKQKMASKNSFIHRLVYASTTKLKYEEQRSRIAEYYEHFLSKFQKNTQTEGVTGILLLYPRCVIHLMESSSEVLYMILKDLNDMEKSPDFPLKEVRILVVSHCVPRLFPSWVCQSVTAPLSLQDPTALQQPVETLVTDSLAMIYKLCIRLIRRDSSSGQEAQQPTVPLEEDTVIYICQNPVLLSPSKFLQIYTNPTHIFMDSEVVWPTQRRLYW